MASRLHIWSWWLYLAVNIRIEIFVLCAIRVLYLNIYCDIKIAVLETVMATRWCGCCMTVVWECHNVIWVGGLVPVHVNVTTTTSAGHTRSLTVSTSSTIHPRVHYSNLILILIFIACWEMVNKENVSLWCILSILQTSQGSIAAYAARLDVNASFKRLFEY